MSLLTPKDKRLVNNAYGTGPKYRPKGLVEKLIDDAAHAQLAKVIGEIEKLNRDNDGIAWFGTAVIKWLDAAKAELGE